jgi:hypothetical protein
MTWDPYEEAERFGKAAANGRAAKNGKVPLGQPGDQYDADQRGDADEDSDPAEQYGSQNQPLGREPKPNPETEPEYGLPVVASALQLDVNPLAWLWRGFIAEKSVNLFSALWKIGKTTLLAHLVRNMGEGVALCGYEVTPATVLYITEESETRWAKRRDVLGIRDNVHFLCRPFTYKPSSARWERFIEHIGKQAIDLTANLVVFDTISALWPVREENDAGAVQAALMPLWTLTKVSALLLVHHLKKGDGLEGTGSRGSGALPSFVDTIMELRRDDPHDRTSRRRTITAYGRDEETPAELIIELDSETNEYRGLGDRKGVKRDEIRRILFSILPTERPGFTFEKIQDTWPEDEFPRKAAMLDALAAGVERGDWIRDGTGRKNQPYQYHVPAGSALA